MRSLSPTMLFFISALIGFVFPFLINLVLMFLPYYESIDRVVAFLNSIGLVLDGISAIAFIAGVVMWRRQ